MPLNTRIYTEADYARIYEEAYNECIALGDDKRVARAVAKARETQARCDQRRRGRKPAAAVQKNSIAPPTEHKKVKVVTIRRSYDAVVNS